MDRKLGGLVVLTVLLMSGCDFTLPQDPTTKSELQTLRDKQKQLEDKISAIEVDSIDREARLRVAEKNVDILFDKTTNSAPQKQFILWEKETPISTNLLIGYKPDRPADTYNNKQECEAAALAFVETKKGRIGTTLAFIDAGGAYPVRFSYTCLPEGVDPRIKR